MAQMQIAQYGGMRCVPASFQSNNTRQFMQQRVSRTRANGPLQISANKKVKKLQEVVVTARGAKAKLGAVGEMTMVTVGHMRNYLYPQKLALPASEAVYAAIHQKEQEDTKAAEKVEAKAQAMATALRTIGRFIIKRRSGDKDSIFGSVTDTDVVKAIESQTGKKLDRKLLVVPEINKLGTYDISARLHANVVGKFKVVIQREKEQQKKAKS